MSAKSFFILLLGLLCLSGGHVFAGELKPFASDGCSFFPDGTRVQKDLWQDCCLAHDQAYWQGGGAQERAAADQELQICVAGVGRPWTANLMLTGVRVGGLPYWPTPFRWGFGWPYGRGYKALTKSELAQVQAMLAAQGLAKETQSDIPKVANFKVEASNKN